MYIKVYLYTGVHENYFPIDWKWALTSVCRNQYCLTSSGEISDINHHVMSNSQKEERGLVS